MLTDDRRLSAVSSITELEGKLAVDLQHIDVAVDVVNIYPEI
jgi:hypothetical protein